MLDYLIVGLGLAGVAFCETLEANGKRFKVISDQSQTSSVVAAGLYNPVILKRFSLAWEAEIQMQLLRPFYAELERKLGVQLDHKINVIRRFSAVGEQNLWFEAADKKGLNKFLSAEILENENPSINAPFGYGKVLKTGRIDTPTLLSSYSDYLLEKGQLLKETFDYNAVAVAADAIKYKSFEAKRIVFCEGYGLKQNSFFNYLPLNGTKGEVLKIQAPNLQIASVIKSSVFIVPLGNDLFGVGATYKWKDKTNTPTPEAREALLEKLNTFLKCEYTLVSHLAGIRPTVTDRRPLVGRHPLHDNLYVLNGMGSRGVMIAPYASQQLFNFIEHNQPIQPEMDIRRFAAKYPLAE